MTLSVLPHRDALRVRDGRMFIGGRWTDDAGVGFNQLHPASNEAVARLASATHDEVDRAVRAARAAFDDGPWPRMRARERKRIMQRIVE